MTGANGDVDVLSFRDSNREIIKCAVKVSANGSYYINVIGLGWHGWFANLGLDSSMRKIDRVLEEREGFGTITYDASQYSEDLCIGSVAKNLATLVKAAEDRYGVMPYVKAHSAAALPVVSLAATTPYQLFQAIALINPIPSIRETFGKLLGGKGAHLLPLYEDPSPTIRKEVVSQAILLGFHVRHKGQATPILEQALCEESLSAMALTALDGLMRTPTLVILGGRDKFLPDGYAELLAGAVPFARIMHIGNLDHDMSTGLLETVKSLNPGRMPPHVEQVAASISDHYRQAV